MSYKSKKKLNIDDILKRTKALKRGHFILSSGLHSQYYLQCALILQYPDYTEILCQKLAGHFKHKRIDAVIAPAVGGIILSYQLAKTLGVRSLFAERKQGKMALRRSLSVKKGEHVLVAEDVVTTGSSVKEVISLVKNLKGRIIGAASLVDRSGIKNPFKVLEYYTLKRLKIKTYTKDRCPLCKKAIPVDKPGSR